MGPGCSSRGPFEDFSISEDVYATGLCAFVRFGFCFEKYGESVNMTLEKNKTGFHANLLQHEIPKNSDISRPPM